MVHSGCNGCNECWNRRSEWMKAVFTKEEEEHTFAHKEQKHTLSKKTRAKPPISGEQNAVVPPSVAVWYLWKRRKRERVRWKGHEKTRRDDFRPFFGMTSLSSTGSPYKLFLRFNRYTYW